MTTEEVHPLMMRHDGNGQVLIGIVIVSSLLFTLASAAALTTSLSSRSRVKTYSSDRVRAYYATEGAAVLAMQKMWADPNYCGETLPAGTATNNLPVTIVVTDVGGVGCTPGADHQVSATVPNY